MFDRYFEPRNYGNPYYYPSRSRDYDEDRYAYLLQQKLQQEELMRQEALRRLEMEREQQRELEYQRRLKIQMAQEKERLKKQKLYEKHLRIKAQQEEEMRRKREEEQRLQREEQERKLEAWKNHINDPQVRETSATTIQSAFRGHQERQNRVLSRLRQLNPVSKRILKTLEENQSFLYNLVQNPLGEVSEAFDEREKKENKDTLWNVSAYEEKLTKELLNLDEISVGRSEVVRSFRKELVQRINAELSVVDGVKKNLIARQAKISEKERLFLEEKERIEREEAEKIETPTEQASPIEQKEQIEEQIEEKIEENNKVEEVEKIEEKEESQTENGSEELKSVEMEEKANETEKLLEDFEMIPSEENQSQIPMEIERETPIEESTTTLSREDELLQIIQKLRQESQEKDRIIEELRSQVSQLRSPVDSQ